MAKNKNAFRIKEGLFTKLIDNKIIGKNKQNSYLRDEKQHDMKFIEDSIESICSRKHNYSTDGSFNKKNEYILQHNDTRQMASNYSLTKINSYNQAMKIIQGMNKNKNKNNLIVQ